MIEQIIFFTKMLFIQKFCWENFQDKPKNLHMNTICFKIQTLIS